MSRQPPDPPSIPPPPALPPGYGPPPTPGYPPAMLPRQNQNALLSLIFAIASWVFCPIVLAILAIVLGHKAQAEIRAANGWETGEGMATAGIWIAWIHLILFGVVLLGVILVFVIIWVIALTSSAAGGAGTR